MERFWRQLAIATNWPVLVAIAVLSILGLISIWAHSRIDVRVAGDVRKQAMFIGVGIACMVLMQGVNYVEIGRFAWGFYLASLALLVYTIIPGAPGVVEVHGARAWIRFGFITLQPAELTKVGFCMVMSRYLRFRSNYRTLVGLLPPFALALVPLIVILKQPDLGTALVFIPALFAMLFVAGAKIRHLLAIIGMGLALVPIAWFAGTDLPVLGRLPPVIKPYQRDRVYAMFSRDPAMMEKTGFQQKQALTAFGSGGLTGRGALNIPVGRTVPEAHNDMILALIGEQFGFVGSIALLGSYLVLFAAGAEISSATREPFGRLLAIGIISMLAGQTFLNVMVALKLMPVTGITLPFVSYGGSSLLASFIAAGFLLNIGQNRPLIVGKDSFEFD